MVYPVSRTVESDETFVGGKAKNMHKAVRERKIKGCGPVGKAIVHGVLERGGKVIAGVVRDQKRSSLQPPIRENVESGSTVYSDALKSYIGVDDEFIHDGIDELTGSFLVCAALLLDADFVGRRISSLLRTICLVMKPGRNPLRLPQTDACETCGGSTGRETCGISGSIRVRFSLQNCKP